MYSWGQECKLVLGAYGGVTFDRRRDKLVYACEPWTPNTLPYSCTALHSLSTQRYYDAKHSGAPRRLPFRHQLAFYRSQYVDSYVPESVLKQAWRESTQDVEARHSCLYTYMNHGVMVLVHPSDPNLSTISFTPLYCEEEEEDDDDEEDKASNEHVTEEYNGQGRRLEPRLITDWSIRRKHCLKGRIKKICADSKGYLIAALTSTSKTYLHVANGCRFTYEIGADEDVYDCCLSQFGRSVLIGAKSGCKLFDTESGKNINSWTIETADGVKHCCVFSEQTYIASSINKLILCDPRSANHRSLPFNIGGRPFGLTTGTVLNTLLFLSGQDSLHAIDLRKPKQPLLQWMNAEFFGGSPLTMLKPVDIQSDHSIDLLTAMSNEQLLSLPITSQPSLNTITSLTPLMQSSLNCNRLFIRLKNRQDIIGHSWIFNSKADSFVSFHMLGDSQHIAYQHHSFSSQYSGNAVESHRTIDNDTSECKPIAEKHYKRKNYSDIYRACTGSDCRKYYTALNETRQQELSSWQVPIKPGNYVSSLFATKTSTSQSDVGKRKLVVDEMFLSSAARVLHKHWDI